MFNSTPSFEARPTNNLQDADAHETTPSSTWKRTQNRLQGRAAGQLRAGNWSPGRAGQGRAGQDPWWPGRACPGRAGPAARMPNLEV